MVDHYTGGTENVIDNPTPEQTAAQVLELKKLRTLDPHSNGDHSQCDTACCRTYRTMCPLHGKVGWIRPECGCEWDSKTRCQRCGTTGSQLRPAGAATIACRCTDWRPEAVEEPLMPCEGCQNWAPRRHSCGPRGRMELMAPRPETTVTIKEPLWHRPAWECRTNCPFCGAERCWDRDCAGRRYINLGTTGTALIP